MQKYENLSKEEEEGRQSGQHFDPKSKQAYCPHTCLQDSKQLDVGRALRECFLTKEVSGFLVSSLKTFAASYLKTTNIRPLEFALPDLFA